MVDAKLALADCTCSPKMHIDRLGLSTRAMRSLLELGIDTYEKLENLSYEEILLLPKLGQVTAAEIYQKLICFKNGILVGDEINESIEIDQADYSIDIVVLNLNKRAYQSLKSAGVNTLGDLSNLCKEELLSINGFGKGSYTHLLQAFHCYCVQKKQLNDLPIDSLGLDNRTLNALRKNNIAYVSQLYSMSLEEIANLRGIGTGSLDRLTSRLKVVTGRSIYTSKELYKLKATDEKTPLEELDFNNRSLNALKSSGFKYIEELTELKDSDFLAIKNIGFKSLEDIREKLTEFLHEDSLFDTNIISIDEYIDLLQKVLTARQKDILNRRLAIYSHYPETLEEIAKDYNLSRERVRQIEKKAKQKMFVPFNLKQAQPIFELLEKILLETGGIASIGHIIKELGNAISVINVNMENAVPIILNIAGVHEISEGLWILKEEDVDKFSEVEEIAKSLLQDKSVSISLETLVKAIHSLLTKERRDHITGLFIESSIKNSKALHIDTLGEVSLATWQSIVTKSRADYASLVLKGLNRPAHYLEITARINEMLPKEAHYSAKSIQVVLGSSDNFIRVKTGTYALIDQIHKY